MGNPENTSAFIPARPIIKVDNHEEFELAEGLLTLQVEENTDGLYRCEAVFNNWGPTNKEAGYLYFDRGLLDFGKKLTIESGSDDTTAQIFNGRIMGLEALFPFNRPPEILVLAEDILQDLRMTRRSRSFEEVSDQDVFEQVAKEHYLKTDLDIDGPTYRLLTQVNQSDLAFLRERARSIDAELWLEDNILHAQARRRRHSEEVNLNYPDGLLQFSVRADLANQCTSLVVGGWDVSAKEGIAYEAAESSIQEELAGRQSGASLTQSVLGERVERLVHLVPENSKEAQYLAKAHFRAKARRFITGSGSTNGDGRIRVGVTLNLEGIGDMFNGKYYVTEVRHTFGWENGYRTYFKVERPGL